MENFLVVLIFIVISILSLAQKWREASAEKRRRGERKLNRDDIPEAARRKLYGEGQTPPPLVIREATPKGGSRTAVPQQVQRKQEQPAREETGPVQVPGKELFEALFGEMLQEPDWEPLQQPAPRPERRPQPVVVGRQPVPQPVRQAQPVVYVEEQEGPPPVPQPRKKRAKAPKVEPGGEMAVRQEREYQRRMREAQGAAPEQKKGKAKRPAKAGSAVKSEIFGRIASLDDIRRGIVMAEILGTPKGLR